LSKVIQKTPVQLNSIINNDPELGEKENQDLKMKFLAMASLYEQDFLKNIAKDSIELSEKHSDIKPEEWLSFLTYPPIKKFIDGFLNEKAEKQAMKALGEGQMKAGDALKIKADIDSKKDRLDNSNIVVWFLPQKTYNFGDGNGDNNI
jgi:hypothetical protein